MIDPHELAEERSLAIHGLVAQRLRAEPHLVTAARDRVRNWLRDGSVHRVYAEEWRRLLDGPLEQLLEVLADAGEKGRALRQCSPFAGAVDPRTRWAIWRDVRARHAPLEMGRGAGEGPGVRQGGGAARPRAARDTAGAPAHDAARS